jgi:hypothetical protein
LILLSEATNQRGGDFSHAANGPNPGSLDEKGGELCRSKISIPYPILTCEDSRGLRLQHSIPSTRAAMRILRNVLRFHDADFSE